MEQQVPTEENYYDYLGKRLERLADDIEAINRMDSNDQDAERLFRIYDHANRCWLTGEEANTAISTLIAERDWFAGLLRLVAKAAHCVEWISLTDNELDTIRACRAYLTKNP
jgi:hypothetical protein